MTFQDIISAIYAESATEREKGAKFEKLIKSWLLLDPRYKQLEHVWLWEEFPAKADFGSTDLGIDLVAKTDGGEYWAIQCKLYASDTSIDKKAVDSFIANANRSFSDPDTNEKNTTFSAHIWISTNDKWNSHAEETVKNQTTPFIRIGQATFEDSVVDWSALFHNKKQEIKLKSPLPHQIEACEKAHEHFQNHDRGKLIMACGTGKTYTSLVLMEQEIKALGGKGTILFMVPSIALLGQSLNEWMTDTSIPMRAICICSDAKASRNTKNKDDSEDTQSAGLDLAHPATTNSKSIAKQMELYKNFEGLLVVFSTYQSIEAVSAAQQEAKKRLGDRAIFDFIVCDEAHRTTGIKLSSKDESAFTKIHNNDIIEGKKRLYMTATPRLYGESVRVKAKENDHLLCSMDDESLYGSEFYRVGFSYAVQHGLLTDYKVLVLTVGSEQDLPPSIQELVRDKDNKEFDMDMASRLVGCINGLSKNIVGDNNATWEADPGLMRRALAFCPNINKEGDLSSSKHTADKFPVLSKDYWHDLSDERKERTVQIEARHIDGSMNSQERTKILNWLKEEPAPNECRLVSNVRCLSEGVDVPALDAVIFLSSRNSQVDVVQSVGRVMRNFRKGQAGEKKYGYIIIPVVVNPNIPAEEALNDNTRFAVVWDILNALRAHDDNFNAIVNKINLNKEKPSKIVVGHVPSMGDAWETENGSPSQSPTKEKNSETSNPYADKIIGQLPLLEGLKKGIYSKLVEKVGSRLYWENWAKEVGTVAQNLIARIRELVSKEGKEQKDFDDFHTALKDNINASISQEQAVEMIAQHLITRPIFEALFEEYNFADNNPVGRSMEKMITALVELGFEKDTAVLNKFYDSVRRDVGGIDNLKGKQTIIKDLYEKFFKHTFAKAVEQLGIVYTPVECVDFILHSVNSLLQKEFNCSLSDENIHILDPFTGTGTFITRLLQSGIIHPEDMERKYLEEIHCNELVLLAYYVADVNIESVFHDITNRKEYLRFNNICLTDTFELTEKHENLLYDSFKDNSELIAKQRATPIKVIVGNPPYSAKQSSANDDNQNLKYPLLDARIEKSYVAQSKSTNKNSLYDSYIRAFRWASDRVKQNKEGGIIGFVTNNKWLDGNSTSGFRKCLEEEFSSIYIFDLKGSIRAKSREDSLREGENIFNIMTGVCIVFLILHPTHKGKADIYYHDIGDYLKRKDKIKKICDFRHVFAKDMQWTQIIPNEHGDWLNLRSDIFESLIVLGDKKDKKNEQTVFEDFYSNGLKTQRDVWCYNFSKKVLEKNIEESIDFYNQQCENIKDGDEIDYDSTKFSWSDNPKMSVKKDQKFNVKHGDFVSASYRPFTKSNLFFSRELNERVYQIPKLFPTPQYENTVICVNGLNARKDFSCMIANLIPDLNNLDGGAQCFPLYYYNENTQGSLLSMGEEKTYTRKDGITDWMLKNVRSRFGNTRTITKEHIFYYVYGILHSKDYRERFNADLKKSLPRIPIVENVDDFMDFSLAGKKLAELHLNYEEIPAHPDIFIKGADSQNFTVEKMKFKSKTDKSVIIYNSHISIENIPLRAYDYVVNGRSAIEWIMERYQIKTDKDSGITNNPNHWAEEHEKPRYILDLICSVINVSMQSLDIVDTLPKLTFEG